MRRAVGAVLVVVALVAPGSCSWTKNSPTHWTLAAPVAGSRLELAVLIPGTERCRPFVGVEISEDDDRVRITARVRRTSSDDCPAADSLRDVVVELQEPLGDRELTGCSPRWLGGGSAARPRPELRRLMPAPPPDCGR